MLPVPLLAKELKEIDILKNMSTLERMPFMARNAIFQKLAEIADITAFSKEDRDKYDDSIKIMRDNIAAYKGAVLEGKIEIAKNMLLDNEPIDKISRYTGLSKDEISRIYT